MVIYCKRLHFDFVFILPLCNRGRLQSTRLDFAAYIVEVRGMGIRTKVIPQVKTITGKEPCFCADEDCLMIVIYRDEATLRTINETINETIKLAPIQKDILREIISNPAVNYEEISERIGVNRGTVARHIAVLKKMGIISRMGSRKTGYWEVNSDKYLDD